MPIAGTDPDGEPWHAGVPRGGQPLPVPREEKNSDGKKGSK